jgi:RimJ/RimL family protein N-acetyltransferase
VSGTPTVPDGRSLVGRTVRLDPADLHDADELFAALDHEAVWASGYNNGLRPTAPVGWRRFMMRAVDTEGRVMYVVRAIDPVTKAPGRIIGTTSLGDIDLGNERMHLGWTAYRPDVWGTSVNPECKLLLLWHAFDHCGFGRVKIQTDLINTRSQAAIAKLGATREGVLRRHIKRADGSWRDTVVFSVIRDEWPLVRAGLELRLAPAQ